jgi:hypothetical protein
MEYLTVHGRSRLATTIRVRDGTRHTWSLTTPPYRLHCRWFLGNCPPSPLSALQKYICTTISISGAVQDSTISACHSSPSIPTGFRTLPAYTPSTERFIATLHQQPSAQSTYLLLHLTYYAAAGKEVDPQVSVYLSTHPPANPLASQPAHLLVETCTAKALHTRSQPASQPASHSVSQ